MNKLFKILLISNFSFTLSAQTSMLCNNQDFRFPISEKEKNCMQGFDRNAGGINNVNAFLLSKMCELVYKERLDYQFRFLRNNREPVTSIPNSDWIKANPIVTEANFECAFASRFSHYFYGKTTDLNQTKIIKPIDKLDLNINKIAIPKLDADLPEFKYIHKTATTSFNLLGMKTSVGIDPELVVVSTKDLVIIIFRGTDNLEDQEWGEWIGTDFNTGMTNAGGALQGTKIHNGFWSSFDLIRDQLLAELIRVKAKDKAIWVTGHSLGGAMAILTGVYLKADGYPVKNIYSYSAPRTIGNDKFAEKANSLLPNRIQRFEYYLDPITLMWVHGYAAFGRRNWMDHKEKGNGYDFFTNIGERFVAVNPFEFNRAAINDSRTAAQVRLHKDKMDGLVTEVSWKFYYHNPQFCNKGLYKRLTQAEKDKLPALDDSFPYLYPSDPLNPYGGGK